MAHLSLRVDLDPAGRLGPGKVRLLEAVRDQGSISAAARALGMSYRRAWTLIEEINGLFGRPAVSAQTGGKAGGGAALTTLGAAIVVHYRAAERAAGTAAAVHLQALQEVMTALEAARGEREGDR